MAIPRSERMIPQPRRQSRRSAALIALCSVWPGFAGVDAALAEETCLGAVAEAAASNIVDARSLRLDDGRVLRLAGIEPFGLLLSEPEEAEATLKRRLAELISGAGLKVRVLSERPDRYGRYPAMIEAGGRLVQETIVGEGLAIAYTGGDTLPCFDILLMAEAAARKARRGFWAENRLPLARPEALASRIGHFAIFEGRVVSVGSRRLRTYLNFGERWLTDVTAEVAAEDREKFGGEAALEALSGQRVRLRGFLETLDGPMLVLRSPMQLEVLGAPDAAGGIPP